MKYLEWFGEIASNKVYVLCGFFLICIQDGFQIRRVR